MKALPLISLALVSLSLYGTSIDSSVNVPTQEHLKYTFGNHKNHPVQKLQERQYLRSLAPMDEMQIKNKLSSQGYVISTIKLRDVASELVYQVYATDTSAKSLRLSVDPTNGSILKTEPLQ
ncbi:PepSY domain-containing protein [Sulfuricurvum sp.]|uniref:PepSY domain-containing protein n=1 Tax=Sulfuricurvum sp. TaxID=2025608 RepID=UPI00286E8D7F|nr:PepSY domain-containing protein [Sulfuricurvum sp.]